MPGHHLIGDRDDVQVAVVVHIGGGGHARLAVGSHHILYLRVEQGRAMRSQVGIEQDAVGFARGGQDIQVAVAVHIGGGDAVRAQAPMR